MGRRMSSQYLDQPVNAVYANQQSRVAGVDPINF